MHSPFMSTKESHTRLWVANLQEDLSKEQIIHLFEKYGAVHNIVRKGNFASIEFENGSEALRAKRGLDQVDYHGRRLNIDWYRGDKFGKLEGPNWWGGQCSHPRFKHRVCVLGLPPAINYQDVLNLAWEAGHSVVFIDIATSPVGFIYGVIEYAQYEEYKFALEYLDGKQFKMNDGSATTLRFIKADQLMSVGRHVAQHGPKNKQTTHSMIAAPMQNTQQPPMPPYYSNMPPPPNYSNVPPNYGPPPPHANYRPPMHPRPPQ
eukprot:64836_1